MPRRILHCPFTMRYFDAHTHVHFAAYENDYREVIERALKANVGMILVGTQKDTSKRGIEVAHECENEPVYPHTNFAIETTDGKVRKTFPSRIDFSKGYETISHETSRKVGVGIYASVGLHPIHTEKSYHDTKELGDGEAAKEFVSRGEEFDYDYYKKLAADPKVVAIGECGLDYYRLGEETKKRQHDVLLSQIKLAYEVKKPLMIHCRNAFADLIALLTTHNSRLNSEPGVIHFFTGSKDDARALLELGFSFTFGGVTTFTHDYNEVVEYIPDDRILSETDAPYVSPAPYRGKRNEPMYIIETVKKLAEFKNLSEEKMAEQILENARRIFGI